jgi:large subunit ribosomal protein L3
VFKGKKMAGQMGAVRNTTQNLEVVAVDDAEGIVLIHGAVSGPKNGWVLISDAVKAAMPEAAPFPAGLMGDASEEDAGADEAAVAEAAPVEEAAAAEDKAPADDADQADADKE